ncbi:uncharacterized protein LOC34617662 [Cyclospora cayetanensis]|uniref:Uncharacterized protein LOC34617662 n=1 Tax=Cyclospora cayetanensis TaxID=88456 RepID=A0A6P6S1Q2_9EIME|nr:uncharacterized protein LOC34617662 [Cyclospora cayetanensis]
MANPQYKRYEVSLGLSGMPDIVVTSEQRGDDTIITVQCKAGTGADTSKNDDLPVAKCDAAQPALTTADTPYTSWDFALKIEEIGVSLVCDSLAEELCFAGMTQVALGLQQRGERQKVVLRIEAIQIDNQMEEGTKPVVLANRGGRGVNSGEWKVTVSGEGFSRASQFPPAELSMPRADSPFCFSFLLHEDDMRLKRSLRYVHEACKHRHNASKPLCVSLMPSAAAQDPQGLPQSPQPFLSLILIRVNSNSSRDIVLKRVILEVDNLEVDIDADMLNGLNDFFWSCLIAFGLADAASRRAVSLEELASWGKQPVQETYSPPPLPTILSLESLVISRFKVYCWCSFVLDKMHMISDMLKFGLRILMASGRLELTGARLTFSQEEFRYLRGTVASFMSCLQERYTYHLLSSLFSSLGQSSLLNLPRMPYEFGRNTIGLAANAVDSVSAGLGSLLSTFTFDAEYINKRQKERGRSASGVREGFLSAGKNIGEGVWALSSIVTKPIEGAQKEGVGGFLKGIGKGLVGSLVKPLDRVGQAVSDVTRGIHAEVSKPIGALKLINRRRRRPRMLGEQGEVRPYDETEAQLRQSLGLAAVRPMQKCITVMKQEGPELRQFAVLFYPQEIFFVNLQMGAPSAGRTGGGAPGSSKGQVNILWHVSVSSIKEVRAGSLGVTIYTSKTSAPAQGAQEALVKAFSADRLLRATQYSQISRAAGRMRGSEESGTYHIPCSTPALVTEVYRELLETQRSNASVVELGIHTRRSALPL